MATISSAGIGSGLDVRGLVEQLVAAEGDPVRTRLDRREADLQEGLTSMASFRGALGEFNSSLEQLKDSQQLHVIDVTSSDVDENYLSITSGNEASAVQFDIDVKQLAQSHKLTSTKFESENVAVGSGVLTFQFGAYNNSNEFILNSEAKVHSLTIDPENSSLRNISEQINKANIGVKTVIINDGNSARLIYSSLSTGENNKLRITVRDNDTFDNDLRGLSTLAYDASRALGAGRNVHETQIAQNSKISIDGIDVSSQTNTINNVIRGVSFDVYATTDKSINVQLQLNNQAVADYVSGFVDSYNQLMSTVDELTSFNPETQVAGPLSGDPTIRGIVNQLRRNLSNTYTGVNEKYISLATIGIDTGRDGKLKLDSNKLMPAITDNLPEVIRLFAKTGLTEDPLIEFISASNQTEPGSHDIKITQLATKGVYLGQNITKQSILIDTTNNSYVFKVDGIISSEISLTQKRYNSIDELAAELQTRINVDENIAQQGVSVSVTNKRGKLQILSNKFGSGSSLELVTNDINSGKLGLVVARGRDGLDVAGTLANNEALGTGQLLHGRLNVEGLKVKVISGSLGERKRVIFSRGIAEQLDMLLAKFSEKEGIFSSRDKGVNTRLDAITRQRDVLARRLAKLEQRLMKQFTTLDSNLAKMRKTSEFLSNQLSGLPGALSQNSSR